MKAELAIQREYELFDAACHLTGPAARRAFLEQACPQNPAMWHRIEELVALQPVAERFFAVANSHLCCSLIKPSNR
jgi:hypothetical protein